MDPTLKATLKEIPYVSIVMGVLDLAEQLISRGRQTGDLTEEQAAQLQTRATGIFAKYAQPAAPPAGG